MNWGTLDLTTYGVLDEVCRERAAQDIKWGEQNHPSICHPFGYESYASNLASVREMNEVAVRVGRLSWDLILAEEVYEAFAEKDPKKLRQELVQIAAVACAWIECLDRRAAKDDPEPTQPDLPLSGAV